ncbi:MAG: PD-(D/E)XK nuclease-like domain-containing protein [Pseudonocardia sp.]|nr:PD-(D/E)XK nuclease-like domain-containing protein [Pseudonocardia sp.]
MTDLATPAAVLADRTPWTVDARTAPGLYPDVPHADYIADPVIGGSLSSTGARRLLASTPEKFRYWQQHPEPPRTTFDVGTAAHREVLGVGPNIVVVPGTGKKGPEVWDTNTTRAHVEEVRAAGDVPVKPSVAVQVREMADALRGNAAARRALAPGGEVELTGVWVDPATGVACRLRADTVHLGPRPLLVEYKTCDDASPGAAEKAMIRYGYHRQGGWHSAGLRHLLDVAAVGFLIVFQEKDPPYAVHVTQPPEIAMMAADRVNRAALQVYEACTLTGLWPGFNGDQGDAAPTVLGYPAWADYDDDDTLSRAAAWAAAVEGS